MILIGLLLWTIIGALILFNIPESLYISSNFRQWIIVVLCGPLTWVSALIVIYGEYRERNGKSNNDSPDS